MTDNDPAVEAAHDAIRARMGGSYTIARLAADAVAAARPIIEAEVRERIAADIEARAAMMSDAARFESHERRTRLFGYAEGATAAARIARGEQ